MAVALRAGRFDTGEVELQYVEGPPSGALLLLLHAGGARSDWWHRGTRMLDALAADWHVFAPDLRGHGSSGRAPGAYRLLDHARDVAAFLEGVVGEPAVVFGHSLGGQVALVASARHPSLVRALIVGDAPPFAAPAAAPAADAAAARERLARLVELVRVERSDAELADALRELALEPPPRRAATADFGEVGDWWGFGAHNLRQLDPDLIAAMGDAQRLLEGYDGDALLPAIACPLLFLQSDPGAGGRIGDAELERALALAPRGERARLTGVGDLLFFDEEPVIEAVRNTDCGGIHNRRGVTSSQTARTTARPHFHYGAT